jgi:hypothetical protein
MVRRRSPSRSTTANSPNSHANGRMIMRLFDARYSADPCVAARFQRPAESLSCQTCRADLAQRRGSFRSAAGPPVLTSRWRCAARIQAGGP